MSTAEPGVLEFTGLMEDGEVMFGLSESVISLPGIGVIEMGWMLDFTG